MLYVFHGSDITKCVEKAHTLLNSLKEKRPDATLVTIDADHFTPSIIEEHLGGQGLFSNKYIIFLDRVSENKEWKDTIGDFISPMKESANIFIVAEGKLLAEQKKLFEKYADKVVVCDESVNQGFKKKEFNIFVLGDALGSRDPFKAWSIYRNAIESGYEAENIIGTLFWQMKSIKLAYSAKTAGEAGLNPFVFGNCKKFTKNFTENEIDEYISRLIIIYHDGHRGILDAEIGLEMFLLNCRKPTL